MKGLSINTVTHLSGFAFTINAPSFNLELLLSSSSSPSPFPSFSFLISTIYSCTNPLFLSPNPLQIYPFSGNYISPLYSFNLLNCKVFVFSIFVKNGGSRLIGVLLPLVFFIYCRFPFYHFNYLHFFSSPVQF